MTQTHHDLAVQEAMQSGNKGKRKKKLQSTPGKVSYRPGQLTTSPTLQRTLTITIPPAGRIGTVEEAAQVLALTDSLDVHKEVGIITASGINNNSWQIIMRLASASTVTDEDALEAAFRVLVPVFSGCELLRTGFGNKKPRWRFTGHDHIDSGHF